MRDNDNKERYSGAVNDFLNKKAADDSGYKKSKSRENKHNDDWEKNSVNINDIVEKFAPNNVVKVNNQKLIYFGGRYNVIADMASGYLRIYDDLLKTYVKLNGKPGTNKETHFKIKKREEM